MLDVTVTAGDGQAMASGTFRLSLAPVNDAPVARADGFGCRGQAPVHDGAATRIDVTALLANDVDPDGGAVRFAGVATGPGAGTLDLVTEGGRTYLVYEYTGPRLKAGATEADAFTYRVADASGGTSTATVGLTVAGLADKSIDGTARSETLLGGDLRHDVIDAGDGRDAVFGRGGRDRLSGANGDDRLHGGNGADRLWGGTGSDRLRGGDGADRLEGGEGDDGLSGGTGDDRLDGAAGADAMFGQAGRDRLLGGHGDDRLHGEGGADTLHGGTGRDRLGGGAGDDGLHGEQGADGLRGGQGADLLRGGGGGDVLNGGLGRDRLWAGRDGDRDVFVLGAAADSRVAARDVLHDFDRGEDRIDLRDMDVLDYAGRRPAAHSVWWAREHGGVAVSGDVTGDGAADFQVVVAGV